MTRSCLAAGNAFFPAAPRQVWVSIDNGIAYVHSDFYNGAASTSQCQRLTAAIQEVGKLDNVKVILLMGGEHSYGNGINLNIIEASADPQMVRQRSSPLRIPKLSTLMTLQKRKYPVRGTRNRSVASIWWPYGF